VTDRRLRIDGLELSVHHVGRGGHIQIENRTYAIEHVDQGHFSIYFPNGNRPSLQSHLDALHKFALRQAPKWCVENRSSLTPSAA